MPRLEKKTLYLDAEALDKIRDALHRLPGRPSVSSFLNEQLPVMADTLDRMVTAAEKGGLRGAAAAIGIVAGEAEQQLEDIEKSLQEDKNADKPLSELRADVPPKKPRKPRAKKVVET